MADHNSSQKNYSELKFSREQGFFDRSVGVRILVGALFVFSLFFLLHFKQERVEIFEMGSVAPSYVVAQVDFEFTDREATIILRQEAVRDVGKIYHFSDKAVREGRADFETWLMNKQDWRKLLGNTSFEEMSDALNQFEKVLSHVRFTDLRTLTKLRTEDMATPTTLVYTPLITGNEVVLPKPVWTQIRQLAFSDKPVPTTTGDTIVTYFADKPWQLVEDIPAQKKLRGHLQSRVKDVGTKVQAGNRIMDQGEKVTDRHIAMLQAMKKALSERRNLWHPLPLLGSLILSLLLAGICVAYFQVNHPSVLRSNRKLFLVVTIFVLTLALAKLTEISILNSKNNLLELVRYPLFVPFAAILLGSLMNLGIATFMSGFLTIILGVTLAFDMQRFMLVNLAASFVAILSIRSLQKRKEIFAVCFKAWLASVGVIFAISFYQNTLWSIGILADIISVAVFLILTAVFIVGLLPLLESTFRIMTDVTLMEYMDPNNELLRRLTLEAPGTYQHTVVVGNIAESAASAIGANGLFCRVATLYHDIGKMTMPQYFTENAQQDVNMHQLLTPKESAQVIMSHVSEGVRLARKAGLPEQFIDIIKEHHGTTLVYYFYRKQLELMGGEKSLVDEGEFRYAGPKPRSKESAIIMVADTLEAASRSLDEFTEEALAAIGDDLIRRKAEDGQFDECLLTFEELAIVKRTLVRTLFASSHRRVKYPKPETGQGESKISSIAEA